MVEKKLNITDFLSLFTAVYVIQNTFLFNRDCLIEYLLSTKKFGIYNNLLKDIKIEDINDEVFNTLEFLSDADQDGIVYIFLPQKISINKLVINGIDYIDLMLHFVNEYKKYENTYNNKTIYKRYNKINK